MDGAVQHEDGEYRVVMTWGVIIWLAGHALGNADTLGLTRVLLWRGQANRRHAHPNCEEVVHVLRGCVRCSVGAMEHRLQPGETVTIEPGVFHHFVNCGDTDAELIVAYGAGDRHLVLEEAL